MTLYIDSAGSENLVIAKTPCGTPKVFFATPSRDGNVCMQFHRSMEQTVEVLNGLGIASVESYVIGDCFIDRARNSLVTEFLDSDCTHLFFVDADTGWDIQAPVRMLARDKDIIVGACRTKNQKEIYPVTIEVDWHGYPIVTDDGLLIAEKCGACFMCIKRDVIMDLIRKHENLGYWESVDRDGEPIVDHRTHYRLFENGILYGMYYGEDTTFVRRWRNLGGQVFIEPNITFQHVDGRNVYTGNYHEFLLRQPRHYEL